MSEPSRSVPGSPLWELTLTRILEVLRDPMALFWTFGFPIFVAVVLGLAFRTAPVAPAPVGVSCTAEPAACKPLLQQLTAAARLRVQKLTPAAAMRDLGRGKLDVVLEIRRGGASEPELIYHLDPSRREAYAARLAVEEALDTRPPQYASREQPYTERGARYIDFLMPGIVALNLMGSGVWGIGFALVEARRRKLLRRLSTTPMRRSHFLLSYMFSRMLLLIPEVALLFGFGVLAFDAPLRGSLAALAFVSLVGAFAFTGVGVLIAARVDSSETAAGWSNFVMMPMWLFSGVFFSYELFPEALHPAIRTLPLTALADALRAIANEAAPLSACLYELLILAIWTVVSFALALRLFRWQ